jgi:hypothetical protein
VILQNPVTPAVQVEAPTAEVNVADVLIGSFGLVGILAAAALLVGLLAGAAFIYIRRWREQHDLIEDDQVQLKLSLSNTRSFE